MNQFTKAKHLLRPSHLRKICINFFPRSLKVLVCSFKFVTKSPSGYDHCTLWYSKPIIQSTHLAPTFFTTPPKSLHGARHRRYSGYCRADHRDSSCRVWILAISGLLKTPLGQNYDEVRKKYYARQMYICASTPPPPQKERILDTGANTRSFHRSSDSLINWLLVRSGRTYAALL